MSRALGLVILSTLFLGLAVTVVRPLWPRLFKRWALLAWLGPWVLVHAAFVLDRHTLPAVWGVLVTAFLVMQMIAFVGGTAVRLVRWGLRLARRRPAPVSVSASPVVGRREFLAHVALPGAVVGFGAGGAVSGSRDFEVRHEEVHVPGLPASMDGFRIGQLTDVHIGDFIDTAYLARAVAALDAAKVDLQVMTGDLIDDVSQVDATMAALDGCRAKHGLIAILGNHEKWRGLSRILTAYEDVAKNGRVKLLVDENLELEHGDTKFRVVGVDYPLTNDKRRKLPKAEQREWMKASAGRAFAGIQPGELILCLTHHPDFFPFAAERGAALTLAGHTHGGQVGFFRVPLFSFAFEHMLGRYRRDRSHLYVSAGTGHWLPYRVGIHTEVTVLTLRAAAA